MKKLIIYLTASILLLSSCSWKPEKEVVTVEKVIAPTIARDNPKISPVLSKLLKTTNFANHPPRGGIPAREKKNITAKIPANGVSFARPPQLYMFSESIFLCNKLITKNAPIFINA